MSRAAAALAAALLLVPAAPGPADAWAERSVPLAPEQPGLVQTAVASCTGGAIIGAMIGALALSVGNFFGVFPSAGLFCGISVAATMVTTATDRLTRLVERMLGGSGPGPERARS
jgi:hypothetical protein